MSGTGTPASRCDQAGQPASPYSPGWAGIHSQADAATSPRSCRSGLQPRSRRILSKLAASTGASPRVAGPDLHGDMPSRGLTGDADHMADGVPVATAADVVHPVGVAPGRRRQADGLGHVGDGDGVAHAGPTRGSGGRRREPSPPHAAPPPAGGPRGLGESRGGGPRRGDGSLRRRRSRVQRVLRPGGGAARGAPNVASREKSGHSQLTARSPAERLSTDRSGESTPHPAGAEGVCPQRRRACEPPALGGRSLV